MVWHGAVSGVRRPAARRLPRLGITEHLAELNGVDREIERVRVEGLLHAAGLTLPAPAPRTARHR